MKIGNWTIFERTKPKVKEKYKAAYEPTGTTKPTRTTFYLGQHSWKQRCEHYDKLTQRYSLAKVAPFTLAGLVTAQGVYFTPAVNRQDETYSLAEEAAYRAEKFKREQQVNSKFYETTWRAAKYGGCFWEITWTPTFGFRTPPLQECIEPADADDEGNITRWRQVVNGTVTAEWTDDLVLVPFLGVETATWPYAPSIFTGLEAELEMLTGIEESAKDYSEKQAWPYEILALGNENTQITDSQFEDARIEWKNRKPGEGIATYNTPVDIKAGGTGSAPIRELAVLCELMKDNVQDSVMVAPISKLYNSTEASAKVMVQHIMTVLGQPWQWRLAEYFETYVLKPWLENAGFSRKSCPQVVFESPDVHKKEEGDYWVSLVTAKIQTPKQACERMDLDYDEEYWAELERKQQKQFQQKVDAQKQGEGEKGVVQREGKSFKVTELFPEVKHEHAPTS